MARPTAPPWVTRRIDDPHQELWAVRNERSEVTGRSGAKGMALVAAASAALAVAAWLFALTMSMFVA